MRLDDWQKWLEEQFLDTNPPEDEKAEEEAKEEPSPPGASAAPKGPMVAIPNASASAPTERPVGPPAVPPVEIRLKAPAPEPQAAETPARAAPPSTEPQRRSSAAYTVPSSVDLPSIENYLPFLRPRVPEPTPIPEAAPPSEPAPAPQATSAQPTVDEKPVPEPVQEMPEPAEEPPAATEAVQPALAAMEEEPDEEPARRPERPVRKRRARTARNVTPPELAPPLTSQEFWELVPRHIRTLISMGQDEGVQRAYRRRFKESRLALIERLLDPTLSLEETARLLNVCPTTVRRYTNRGQLRHYRTEGDQRRFRLSDVLAFLEAQQGDKGPGSPGG